MLEGARGVDHAIWVVAFLFYAFDSARLLSACEILLVEASHGRLTGAVGSNPFGRTGRLLTFDPLLLPHRATWVTPWGRPWTDDLALSAELRSLAELQAVLLLPRIVAVWAFVSLFLLGPGLTVAFGPDAAVLCVAVLVYPTALAAGIGLWWQRRHLGLSSGRSVLLGLELLVCPAFLPNLVRKVSARHAIEIDGGQLLASRAAPDRKDELLGRLECRTEELIGETSVDEPAREHLLAYLATVRAAR